MRDGDVGLRHQAVRQPAESRVVPDAADAADEEARVGGGEGALGGLDVGETEGVGGALDLRGSVVLEDGEEGVQRAAGGGAVELGEGGDNLARWEGVRAAQMRGKEKCRQVRGDRVHAALRDDDGARPEGRVVVLIHHLLVPGDLAGAIARMSRGLVECESRGLSQSYQSR